MFKCYFTKRLFLAFYITFGCAGPSLLRVGFPLQWRLKRCSTPEFKGTAAATPVRGQYRRAASTHGRLREAKAWKRNPGKNAGLEVQSRVSPLQILFSRQQREGGEGNR